MNIIDNPWVKWNIKVWKTIDITISKWWAYDSDFTPNKLDTRFKEWTAKSITILCSILKDGTLLSFETLKETHLLEKQDSHRYL